MPTSKWEPRGGQIAQEITDLITLDREALDVLPEQHRDHCNLTQEEVTALRNLAKNRNIVIKPADKGSAIVIMDREQYIWEAERQLNNQEHYRKLQEPTYLKTVEDINKIIDTLLDKKYINTKQSSYLKGKEAPRARIFYLLPKIHKAPDTWPKPYEIPSGRPIVSDCNSESYRTAEYIDFFLNPLSNRHPSYIKDTYDFVAKIRGITVPQSAFLFSIDVDSLYTNIETTEGLKAVRKWFNKYPDKDRPDAEILELLFINLTKNDFEFNQEFYLQIKGTAMGKKFAPAYADIYMADWEETVFEKCTHKPTHYFRYLDDIWGTWTHGTDTFLDFMNILNTHHTSIKVKHTTHNSSINFLDTTTYKGPDFNRTNTLDTKVYFKDTDTHSLLHKNSFHPKHTFRGLVKSQLLRFHRICSQSTEFEKATQTLYGSLRKRGYARSFLRKIRKSFLETKEKNLKTPIPLITTYSSLSIHINNRIKRNFEDTQRNNSVMQEFRIISAYRKNKNLQDILVKSKLKPKPGQPHKNKPQFFKEKKSVKNRGTKQVFPILQKINLDTRNCVYIITCNKCGSQYIGETGNSIRIRLAQHRYNIKNQKEMHTKLVPHFLEHGLQSLEVSGLEHNINWTAAQRQQTERYWIRQLDTRYPTGLNIK